MTTNTFIDQLRQLGLSNGEARVYISLLGLYAPSKVGLIVKESYVSYSKVYDVLRRLIEKGLVSHVIINNIKYFSAVEPYRLFDYIQGKESEVKEQRLVVEKIVPELTDLIERDRDKVKSVSKKRQAEIFTGDKGLRTAYDILLGVYNNNDINTNNTIDHAYTKSKTNKNSTNSIVEKSPATITTYEKRDILRYFYPYGDYHPIASPFYSRLYKFQKSRKNLRERGIGTIAFKESKHFKEQVPKSVNMRFVKFPLPGTMDIFKDKVLVVSWQSKPTGILITSREIADHFKRYFDSLWALARS
jgi:HTH-type transcriptional regulator, sugar sensing transcriptional regulator